VLRRTRRVDLVIVVMMMYVLMHLKNEKNVNLSSQFRNFHSHCLHRRQ
jgi:hypothetical protein